MSCRKLIILGYIRNMKKVLSLFLSLALLNSPFLRAYDFLEQGNDESNAMYDTCGDGSEDGVYTATSTSMVGWGVGLAAAIALLAGLLRQSTSNTKH